MIYFRLLAICLFVVYAAQLLTVRSVQGKDIEINAAFYVLVDLSKSYFDQDTKVDMRRTLDQVNEILLELSRRHPSPMLFNFLSIDEISLGSKPLCEAVLKATIFGGGQSDKFGGITVLTKRRKLESFLQVCRDLILHQKPKRGTDITGAVDLAARMARGQFRGPKAMIIVSDFVEERWNGAVATDVNLEGFKVALIYRVRKGAAKDPMMFDKNISAWKERLLSAGAEKVVVTIERGVFSPVIIDGLSP